MRSRFLDRLDRALEERDSLLCVGLDPDPELGPKGLRGRAAAAVLRRFLDGIVDATKPYAAAYKMQLACYLRFGSAGIRELERLVERIGRSRITILDFKANDIPNTMRHARDAAFDTLGFDAVTLTPWLGWETLEPFAERTDRGFFVLAHSSNPGAPDFQEIPTPRGPLWTAVLDEVRRLAEERGNAGAVVGAPFVDAVRLARETLGPRVPLLLPGIGAQGGALSAAVRAAVGDRGRALLVSASRSILYADPGANWKRAAAAEARRLRDEINRNRADARTGRAGRG
jgi:orotidine-5'-phosphate decarboxylase